MYKYLQKYKKSGAILGLLFTMQGAIAQIGINTENIPANILLIVDGAKDNPATGTINKAAQINDVVVTDRGLVGIGLHNPKAKVDVNTNGVAGMHGFRFAVPTASIPSFGLAGYVIKYMADGTASWQPQARTATPVNVNITDGLPLPAGVATTLTGVGLPFNAPLRSAFFAFEIRFWAEVTGVPAPIPAGTQLPRWALLISLVRTRAGVNTVIDRFRFTSFGSFQNAAGITSSTTLYARTQPGDVINVAVEPLTVQIGTLRMRQISAGWTTSKVRIIELQAENNVELH